MELNKPKATLEQEQIEREIHRWLSAPFLAELIRYQLQEQVVAGICSLTSTPQRSRNYSISAWVAPYC